MFEPTSHEAGLLNRASLDHCVKCTICETQCPVMAATPLFPGPKYVGPQAERFREGASVDRSLDYCSACGTCTLVCPQGVKIAELNTVAKAALVAQHIPLRDQVISRTTLLGRAMTPIAPLANWALRQRPIRVVAEKVMGIDRDAPMPTAHRHTFADWLRRHRPPAGPAPRGPIVFFHGCAGQFFEVETSIKTVEVLEYLGYEVIVPRQGCCGLPLKSNGIFDAARTSVRRLARQLTAGLPPEALIVTAAGSCASMLKHEARDVLGVEDPELLAVGERMRDISELLLELADDGSLPLDFDPMDVSVAYHAPCQVRGAGMGTPALELLRLIPGLNVVPDDAPCCGMAGTYAIKHEKHAIAVAVGRDVFAGVRATNPKLAVCDTETCRWHIAHETGAQVVHPVWLLHQAWGLSSGLEAGDGPRRA